MFSELLKQRRKELNLTQQEVAEQLTVTRQTVSSWEVGKSIPDINTLIKLSELYDISLDNLIKGNTDIKNQIKKDTDIVQSNKKVLGVLLIVGLSFILFLLIKTFFKLPQTTDPFINGIMILILVACGIFYVIKQNYLATFKLELVLVKKIIFLLLVVVVSFSVSSFLNSLIDIPWQKNTIKVIDTLIVAISGGYLFKQAK